MRQIFKNKCRSFPKDGSMQGPEFSLPSSSESEQHMQKTHSPFSFL